MPSPAIERLELLVFLFPVPVTVTESAIVWVVLLTWLPVQSTAETFSVVIPPIAAQTTIAETMCFLFFIFLISPNSNIIPYKY